MKVISDDYNETLEFAIKESILCFVKNFKDHEGFLEYTDPSTIENINKKISLAGILELFKEFKAQELVDKIDEIAFCQTLLDFSCRDEFLK